MRYSRLLCTVAFGVAALCSAGSAPAAPLFDATDDAAIFNPTNLTLGYKFTVINPITIDGIGIFDEDADGLAAKHDLILWNGAATAIVTGSIGPLSDAENYDWSDSELGGFVYQNIVPTVLAPGDYVVAATYANGNGNKDGVAYEPSEVIENFSGDVKFAGGVYSFFSGSTIEFPTIAGSEWFGPALRHAYDEPVVATVSIPEPLTFALLAVGVAGMRFSRRARG